MAGRLKPLDVERETRPGKYPDGDGLYLIIASATSKNWSYRYHRGRRFKGTGVAHSIEDRMSRADVYAAAIVSHLAWAYGATCGCLS
jgi:hypothetical protein